MYFHRGSEEVQAVHVDQSRSFSVTAVPHGLLVDCYTAYIYQTSLAHASFLPPQFF
jgi:hypothetical protein